MDYETDYMEEQERYLRLKRMSSKLAKNKSRRRVVRKLSQTVVVVPAVESRSAVGLRRSLNHRKRLTYIILLGLTLGAAVFDLDGDAMLDIVQHVTAIAR